MKTGIIKGTSEPSRAMPMRRRETVIHVNLFGLESRLDAIQASLNSLLGLPRQVGQIMQDISELQADVAAESSAVDSAVVLLNGIAERLTAAGVDPAALAALQADIVAHTQALAAAVASVPAAPTPAPAPVEAPPVEPAPPADVAPPA